MVLTTRSFGPVLVNPNALEGSGPTVLAKVSASQMVGLLIQIGQISEYAADLFHNLFTEATATSQRISTLIQKTTAIEDNMLPMDDKIKSTPASVFYNNTADVTWKRADDMAHSFFSYSSRPAPIDKVRQLAYPPPAVSIMDDLCGRDCSKHYSDPAFFFEQWQKEELKKLETAERQNAGAKRKKRNKKPKAAAPVAVAGIEVKVYSSQGAEFGGPVMQSVAGGNEAQAAHQRLLEQQQQLVQQQHQQYMEKLSQSPTHQQQQHFHPSASPAPVPVQQTQQPQQQVMSPPVHAPVPQAQPQLHFEQPQPQEQQHQQPQPPTPVMAPAPVQQVQTPAPPAPVFAAPPAPVLDLAAPPAPTLDLFSAPAAPALDLSAPAAPALPLVNAAAARPAPVSTGPPRNDLLSAISGGIKLKKVTAEEKAPSPTSGRGGLLDEIKNRSFQLRKPIVEPVKQAPKDNGPAGLGAVMNILARRRAIQDSSEDDSDDDEW